jgi:hypothetical protein
MVQRDRLQSAILIAEHCMGPTGKPQGNLAITGGPDGAATNAFNAAGELRAGPLPAEGAGRILGGTDSISVLPELLCRRLTDRLPVNEFPVTPKRLVSTGTLA